MKLDINNSLLCTFKGIAKPYNLDDGSSVIPISKVPNTQENQKAVLVAKEGINPHSGFNGNCFWLGEDLVVKKYKGRLAHNDNPMREIDMLDTMFENGINFPNSQIGCWAYQDKEGQYYLISTKVPGQNPDAKENPFTKENIHSLVNIILNMDMGATVPNSSKSNHSDLCRFMNYDFNGKNINLTPTQAGMFDFEYGVIENLDDLIDKNIIQQRMGVNCHRSDTSEIPASIRSFELYCFAYYLREAKNPKEIFNHYLEAKSHYHEQMSDYFAQNASTSDYSDICINIATKEKIHAFALRKELDGQVDTKVKKAEAIKIQLSNFIHESTIFCSTGKINRKLLKDYCEYALFYFNNCYQEAIQDGDFIKVVYFKDGIDLIKNWAQINPSLDYQIDEVKDKNYTKKLTNEPIKPLEEICV